MPRAQGLGRLAAGLGSVLLLVAGCTTSPSRPSSPDSSWSPPPGAPALQGGCSKTHVFAGGVTAPGWARAGFSGIGGPPWALSESGRAVAYLFAKQVVAGPRPDGTSNKVLWVVRDPAVPRITAHPAGQAAPAVEIGGQGANLNQLPSIVDLPAPGCWSFELAWRGSSDRISLQVLPAGSSPSQGGRPALALSQPPTLLG